MLRACIFAGLALAVPVGRVLAVDVAAHGPVFGAAATIEGEDLHCLDGATSARVGFLACREACEPIPWQLDERGADGELSLENGPFPNPDEPPDLIDANDEIRWMIEDSGRVMQPRERPAGVSCAIEIRLDEAETGYEGHVYAFVWPKQAPRSERSYVRYDPARDVIVGQRVALGFAGPTPQYLALTWPDGTERENLLDRLKIRVSAWFLGMIPVGRDEGDVTTEFVAWHGGPIRIVRSQRQWVRVGFGLRSPTFGSYTYFYRDFAELPVSLRLNYPPTYFFRRIGIRAVLDFRDLRGWRVLAEGLNEPLTIGSLSGRELKRLDGAPDDWLALIGPEVTFVQFLSKSPSLATVRSALAYAEDTAPHTPEGVPGEMPGVGYLLSNWNDVPAGRHWFSSTSVALPAGEDPRDFVRARQRRIRIHTREIAASGPVD